MPNYYSDLGPDFKKRTIKLKSIPAFQYEKTLAEEFKTKNINKDEIIEMYESMLVIREFEEMILKQRTGAYEIISDYEYRGPTRKDGCFEPSEQQRDKGDTTLGGFICTLHSKWVKYLLFFGELSAKRYALRQLSQIPYMFICLPEGSKDELLAILSVSSFIDSSMGISLTLPHFSHIRCRCSSLLSSYFDFSPEMGTSTTTPSCTIVRIFL